ncbi:chorismate-binding protein [Maribacter sp. 2307ULW6-5]|uniref:chorismate-binding protein n=1 Tax=Maribacter sp. 2307ULW6-5 TaxID=3386275 RepID=UPI0039BC34AA
MEALFNKAAEQLQGQLPFVLYRKPKGRRLKGVFQQDDTLNTVGNYQESGFVFAPFHSAARAVLLPWEQTLEVSVDYEQMDFGTAAMAAPSPGAAAKHMRLVRKGMMAIASGQMDKVVLSRKMEQPLRAGPLTIFKRLLAAHRGAFCYLWYHPKIGMWLGATPEILLSTRGSSLTTMSLAGTLPYVEGKRPQWSKKELEEQQMVTDYITQTLTPHVAGLKISDTQTVRAGKLWHLRTQISAKYKKDDLGTIVRQLHPTPAVCGLPARAAKEFILAHEGYDRNYYTGFLGELNLKEEVYRDRGRHNVENLAYRAIKTTSDLYVNLRCMEVRQDRAHLYVGGGITAFSDPKKEWEETVSKTSTILRVLG